MESPPTPQTVELRVQIPAAWRTELKEAAAAQAISVSDLVRLLLRGFLRQRYTDEEREVLTR